jgi:cell division protein ZapA
MKQIEVKIMGQSYLLGTPEQGDARLIDAVEKVDTAMCKIRDAGKIKARDRIAVLAALNLAFELSDRAPNPEPLAPRHSESSSPANGPAAPDDAQLEALIKRLDVALGIDGRLL